HWQSRARQMKIGEQRIDNSKRERRMDEHIRLTRLRLNLPLVRLDWLKQSSFKRSCFQNAHDRCSDSYEAVCTVHPSRGFWRNGKPLGMHAMPGDVIGSHRQKCSRAQV